MTGCALNRRVQTGAGTLAVADSGGPGDPVVLWPSLFSDHRLYDHVVDQLGDDWRAIRIDGPGFGHSSAPERDIQPAEYACAVVELLDALGIDTAIVAGCSWGGQVAAHFGAQFPQRCRGVLMMNTPLEPSRGGQTIQVLATRWFGSTTFWGRGVARSMIAQATKRDHPQRVEAFVAAFRSFDRVAAATTVRTVLARSPGLADILPRLKVPTTILLGAEDRLYPVDAATPPARSVAQANVEIIQSCGHLSPLEAPEAVVRALQALAVHA